MKREFWVWQWLDGMLDTGLYSSEALCAEMHYLEHGRPVQLVPITELEAAQKDADALRAALKFYADGDHFNFDDSAWDTVSDEPQNYWCDEAGTATVEDGTIAKLAINAAIAAQEKS